MRLNAYIIEQDEHLTLSERDSLWVLEALENPSAPNAKLLAAARRLPKGAPRVLRL